MDSIVRAQFTAGRERPIGVSWTHPADLVVLVNEAAPALQAKTLIDLLRYGNVTSGRPANPRFTCGTDTRWSPLIISITSEGDTATKRWFPIGATLDSMFQQFRPYEISAMTLEGCGTTGGEAPPPIPSQATLYRHTAGHVPSLRSHELRYRKLASAAPKSEFVPQPCEPKFCIDETVPAGQSDDSICITMNGHEFRVHAIEDSFNTTPYWIMSAPRSIVADHGDIFNEQFTALLTGVVAASGALDMSAEDYVNAGWCVWHEGVRVYDAELPGRRLPPPMIRQQCLGVQAHNPRAQSVVSAVSDEQLSAILTVLGWAVEKRFDLPRHFAEVMKSGYGTEFSKLVEQGNYEEVRRIFGRVTQYEPNVRNLLAAVSNQRIRELVQINE